MIRWEERGSLVISLPGGGWKRPFHHHITGGGGFWRVSESSGPWSDLSPTRPGKSNPVLSSLDFQTTIVLPNCTWQLPPIQTFWAPWIISHAEESPSWNISWALIIRRCYDYCYIMGQESIRLILKWSMGIFWAALMANEQTATWSRESPW